MKSKFQSLNASRSTSGMIYSYDALVAKHLFDIDGILPIPLFLNSVFIKDLSFYLNLKCILPVRLLFNSSSCDIKKAN